MTLLIMQNRLLKVKNEYIDINEKECKLCGGCVSVCPKKILLMTEEKIKIQNGCIDCKICIKFCPVGAIDEI